MEKGTKLNRERQGAVYTYADRAFFGMVVLWSRHGWRAEAFIDGGSVSCHSGETRRGVLQAAESSMFEEFAARERNNDR